MIALTLRGLAERKLRSVLTGIAVMLGVAMIAGTYVLTDQIRNGFSELQDSVYSGVDVEVAPKREFSSSFNVPEPMDEKLVDVVRRVPGVAAAQGDLWTSGGLVVDGELQKASGGGGTIITTASGEPFSPASDVDGRLPERSHEVALLRDTADKYDLGPGDKIGIATARGVANVTVVGTYKIGSANAGGTDVVSVPLADIQAWFDRKGEVTSILVAAAEGVTPEELTQRIDRVVPAGVEVRTGQAAADETAGEINDQIGSFLTPSLLAFAGAALLVGAFIIFNTFTITVAERTREFAMLRTLGATRRQILSAVTLEAVVIGLAASILGLGLGMLFAKGLAALFQAVGLGIPTAGFALAPRTVVIALVVGLGVTLVAALSPARRATRVPPIAALQRGDQEVRSKGHRFAPWIAGIVTVAGIAALVAGLFASGPASSRLATMALGVVLLFIGVALSARWFVRPLASALGWPLQRLFAEPGLLARENAMRNPGRTATTAAALMVGLGLVVFVAVFANGIKVSVTDTVGRLVTADLIVRTDTFQPIPAGAATAISKIPDAEVTQGVLIDQVKVDGKKSSAVVDIINGIDPTTLEVVYKPDWLDGSGPESLARLRGNTALIEEQFAKAHHLDVGDTYEMQSPAGRKARVTVVGKYRDPQLLQGTIIPRELFLRVSASQDPWIIIVSTRADADADAALADAEKALAPFPAAKVESQGDYTKSITDQLNQFVYLLYALLAMSVIISLFGIANSLFLSVHERTREFGLLRAVGATRSQVRRMVRYESIITSVIGGLLGVVVGLVFAWLVTSSLDDLGLGFAIPGGQLVVFMVLAVLVGVAAAAFPARRGARTSVLEALRAE